MKILKNIINVVLILIIDICVYNICYIFIII